MNIFSCFLIDFGKLINVLAMALVLKAKDYATREIESK